MCGKERTRITTKQGLSLDFILEAKDILSVFKHFLQCFKMEFFKYYSGFYVKNGL